METIADYQDLCGECPIWDPATATLYWTDCVSQRFYRYRPETGTHEIVKQGLELNGFRLNEGGGTVFTHNSAIRPWDGGASVRMIAHRSTADKCQVHDALEAPESQHLAGPGLY